MTLMPLTSLESSQCLCGVVLLSFKSSDTTSRLLITLPRVISCCFPEVWQLRVQVYRCIRMSYISKDPTGRVDH